MESAHIAKLFSILEATSGSPSGRSLAELASEVGLAKSTAHRLLQSLCSLGYMTNCGSGIYKQTALLRQLANGFEDQRLIDLALPSMLELRSSTGETVNLGVMRMERIVYLHVVESFQPLRRIVKASMTDPALSTALGRAIVAYQSPQRRNYILRKVTIEKRTPHTTVDPDELESILDQVKRQGYAVEENQTDLGVICTAAPVFDEERNVVAALSISAPIARMSPIKKADMIQLVLQAARHVTDLLANPSNPGPFGSSCSPDAKHRELSQRAASSPSSHIKPTNSKQSRIRLQRLDSSTKEPANAIHTSKGT